MKKFIVTIVAIIVSISATSLAFQNEPDGFRGIKWGADIGELPRMEHLRDHTTDFGGIKIYVNREDELNIGDASVSEIKYYFWKNKFYKVSSSTSDLLNSGKIWHSCLDKFGVQKDFIASAYRWVGPVTKVVVTEPNYSGNLFWMESVLITNKLNLLEKQKDSERATKGF
jgi:hypothetical protein